MDGMRRRNAHNIPHRAESYWQHPSPEVLYSVNTTAKAHKEQCVSCFATSMKLAKGYIL